MSGILRLESLTKGNTLRQGDLTLLKYRLFDADGDKLDISGKSATVRLMKNDFTFIAYEKEGFTVAPNDTISFSVNKVLPAGLYHLEVIVDDKYIFPSRDDEGKLNVDKSSLGADVTIVEATGVEAVARKATGMMKQDEEFIDDMIANVISDTNVGNIEEYYNQFNEAIDEFADLKPKALSAVSKSDEALTKSQTALNVANGIDAKATNALSLSESADTLSKSVQEQFNQVVIDGDSSVEAAQARVDASGQTNPTLKARLDKEYNEVTAQLAHIESVQPLYFDGTINLGDVIKSAVDNKNKKIKIPAGTYIIDETIAVNLKAIDIEIEGEGSTEGHAKTRLLWRGGAGTMFNLTGVRYIDFKNIEISGFIPGDEPKIVSGATGLNVDGVIRMENVVFMGFETLVDYAGGFYHKFINCQFAYFKLGFKNVNAFNFNFLLCRFFDFESIIEITGGTGPLTFNMCSVEGWSGRAISGVAGTKTLINFVNGYIENYPGRTAPTGLDGDYTQSTFIYGGGVINLENNAIITSGIKRLVYGSGATEKITSVGNSIRYNNLGSLEYYIFNPVNVKDVFTNDYAREGGLSQPATNVASYLASNSRTNSNYRYAYDAFEKKFIKKMSFEPTLNQGWIDGNSNVEKLGVILENGTVVFRGVAKNEDVTSKKITTLPIEYRPSKQVYLPIITTRGDISVLWVYPDGRLFINDMTSIENQTVIFNGLSYEL